MFSLAGQRTIDSGYTPVEILMSEEGKITLPGPVVIDATAAIDGANTGRTDELRPGCLMGQNTASGKWAPLKRSAANGAGIAATSLVVDNARFFKVGDTITVKGARGIVKATHDASAASNGTALYLHLDELGESPYGHLESVCAGNADSKFTTIDGAVVKVEDDDAAATGGTQIYIDEDATNPDERFLSTTATGKDAFILASDGRAIRIKYHAAPGTPGVALYFDDDAATVSARLLFVSPTTANAVVVTDDVASNVVDSDKITRSSSNAVTAIDYTTNTLTVTAATWADDDEVIADGTAGAGYETAKGILATGVRLLSGEVGNTTWYDKEGVILAGGYVIQNNVLGDLTAARTDTSNRLSAFIWSDRQQNL